MKNGAITGLVILLFFMMLCGLTLLALSFTALLPGELNNKGMRAIGFALLFLGLGEFLNHPVQTGHKFEKPAKQEASKFLMRRRNPCGLGNYLDVIGIIAVFAALALFFFPYQP